LFVLCYLDSSYSKSDTSIPQSYCGTSCLLFKGKPARIKGDFSKEMLKTFILLRHYKWNKK
jgi:hypothetical protein